MIRHKETKKSGYSLVEMIIYLAILSVVSLLMINTTLSFTRSYRNVVALRKVDHSAVDVMERLTRDIRSANQVDSINSVFGTNLGVLVIISTVDGVSTTEKFYFQNGVIRLDVNGSYFGPLSASDSVINSLVFTKLESGISTAIKIDMTVSGTAGTVTETRTYHSTVVLRAV
ncbi:MAG: prepilin-type N-terminal cleavage/methylation domain-containing protein [Candidatus Paceibacterota bacterium]|jgi:type II secretory pathway pseudopilin PulG